MLSRDRKFVLKTKSHADAIVIHFSNGFIPLLLSFFVKSMNKATLSQNVHTGLTVRKNLHLKIECTILVFGIPFTKLLPCLWFHTVRRVILEVCWCGNMTL